MRKFRAKTKFHFFGRNFSKFLRIFEIFENFWKHDFSIFKGFSLFSKKSWFRKISIFSKFSKFSKIFDQNFWNFVFALTFFIFEIFGWFFLQIEVDFRGGFDFFYQNLQQNPLERTKRILYYLSLNAFWKYEYASPFPWTPPCVGTGTSSELKIPKKSNSSTRKIFFWHLFHKKILQIWRYLVGRFIFCRRPPLNSQNSIRKKFEQVGDIPEI